MSAPTCTAACPNMDGMRYKLKTLACGRFFDSSFNGDALAILKKQTVIIRPAMVACLDFGLN